MITSFTCPISNIHNLTENTFLISVDCPEIKFQAGQYMIINFPGEKESREYSIYNKMNEGNLQFLIRDIKGGHLSTRLKHADNNTLLELKGPYGFFTISQQSIADQKITFIATGTGISPIHSMIETNPNLDYHIIHGIRYPEEKYHFSDYDPSKYRACVSAAKSDDYIGRVTDYIKSATLRTNSLYYISGNSAMINEVTDYLVNENIPLNNIHSEIYF